MGKKVNNKDYLAEALKKLDFFILTRDITGIDEIGLINFAEIIATESSEECYMDVKQALALEIESVKALKYA